MKRLVAAALLVVTPFGPVQAQVNVGNVEVARLCSDSAFALLTLAQAAKGETINAVFSQETSADRLVDQLHGKFAFLRVIADQATTKVLAIHLEEGQLIQTMESVPTCLAKSNCMKDTETYLTQAAWDLWAACRADYTGE